MVNEKSGCTVLTALLCSFLGNEGAEFEGEWEVW